MRPKPAFLNWVNCCQEKMITDMKVEFGGAAAPSVIPTEVEGSRAVYGAQAKSGAPAIPQARSSEACAEHRLRLTDEARSLDSAGDHERLLPLSSEVAGPTDPLVSEQQEKRARPFYLVGWAFLTIVRRPFQPVMISTLTRATISKG